MQSENLIKVIKQSTVYSRVLVEKFRTKFGKYFINSTYTRVNFYEVALCFNSFYVCFRAFRISLWSILKCKFWSNFWTYFFNSTYTRIDLYASIYGKSFRLKSPTICVHIEVQKCFRNGPGIGLQLIDDLPSRLRLFQFFGNPRRTFVFGRRLRVWGRWSSKETWLRVWGHGSIWDLWTL